jgi:hypothetical protein
MMECDEVRKEFPEIHFPACCESCHEDEAIGHGYDLWLEIGGDDRHVCCSIMNGMERHRKELDR